MSGWQEANCDLRRELAELLPGPGRLQSAPARLAESPALAGAR